MFERILGISFQVIASAWVIFAWLRWSKTFSAEIHNWRGIVLLLAFLATTFSLAVVVGLSIRAYIHGGYRFSDAPQGVLMGLALLAGILAFVGGLIGKGLPRLTIVMCSLFCLVALCVEFKAN